MDPLLASLLDLHSELDSRGIPLMIGGGFGLFLKRRHLTATGERTLLSQLPEPRSTNDLDLFLRADVLASLDRTREVADAIRRLGYGPVKGAEYMQWKRSVLVGDVEQEVKVDMLVGPIEGYREKLHFKKPPRVRPQGEIQFHARAVEEALFVEDAPVVIRVEGKRSTGEPYAATVQVPEAFPYLMMKLHAFADRKDDADKDMGRHHALDVYTIVGMMTEPEYERAKELGSAHARDPRVERAREIARNEFVWRAGFGRIRLMEHRLFRSEFQLIECAGVLREIFQEPSA